MLYNTYVKNFVKEFLLDDLLGSANSAISLECNNPELVLNLLNEIKERFV